MTERDVGDVVAGLGALGALYGWVPDLAALLAIIWTLIRIYEWSRVRIFKIDEKETFK